MVRQGISCQASDLAWPLEGVNAHLIVAETEDLPVTFQIASANRPPFLVQDVGLFECVIHFEAAWILFVTIGRAVGNGTRFEQGPDEV